MNGSAIQTIEASHQHLVRDLPTPIARLWGLRLAPILALGYLGAVLPRTQAGVVVLGFALLLLAVRWWFRGSRYLALKTVDCRDRDVRIDQGHLNPLVCIGDAAELQHVADLREEFFEPIVSPYSSIGRTSAEWAMIIVGFVVLVGSTRFLGMGPLGAATLTVGIAICVSLLSCLGRSYYRVVPAYVEDLSHALFRQEVHLRQSVPVWGARITCRYDRRTLTIEPDASMAHYQCTKHAKNLRIKPLSIDLSRILQPHVFCQSVFRAAICKHPAPDLPSSDLLG